MTAIYINNKKIRDIREFTAQWRGSKPAKGTLKEYEAIYYGHVTGDWSRAHATNLYTKRGGWYCTALEVLNHFYKNDRIDYQEARARLDKKLSEILAS